MEGCSCGFLMSAVKRLEVERELAQVLRLKATDFQFDRHKAVQATVEEEQVQREIAATDLNWHFGPHVAEVTSEFREEAAGAFRGGPCGGQPPGDPAADPGIQEHRCP